MEPPPPPAPQSWSIGIYAGDSPLRLSPAPGAGNPVLTAHQVTDLTAAFVADPFMVQVGGTWHMFFEVLEARSGKGVIGLATSADALKWSYERIVVEEPFHLSYPCVFERGGEYFMIPETLEAGAVRLYQAQPFPTRWTHVADLIAGRYSDPSIFYFDRKLWLFTAPHNRALPPGQKCDTLRLHCADHLFGPWAEHPMSPLIEGDIRTARPGGRVVPYNGRVIRFTQDCYPVYGSRVRAFEITQLTPQRYAETESRASPVLAGSGAGWNGGLMHHVDPHPTAHGRWLACVDGHPA